MIRIGIVGYGNLGKGVEAAVKNALDTELVAFFTRRDPALVVTNTPDVPIVKYSELPSYQDKIDVIINCGGSATDLPVTTPEIARYFSVIDSFDTHAKIPEHFERVDGAARAANKVAVISVGWDPGLFSLYRVFADSILPSGNSYTFWGRGVSQGHSDAIRRIEGVLDARQYTVPSDDALRRVRNNENPILTQREKHTRECYVVAKEGADLKRIEEEIKTMPNYFADYDTTVYFISEEEMKKNHSALPHGGCVIRTGNTGENLTTKQKMEFSLTLDSNPEFTASVLVAYARAAYKLSQKGEVGCKTVYDVPPALLSDKSADEIRKTML